MMALFRIVLLKFWLVKLVFGLQFIISAVGPTVLAACRPFCTGLAFLKVSGFSGVL